MATYLTSEQTRRALIQATGELAAGVGFSNVSTRAVAMKAGESIGSIHYHFGGKEKLFQAVLMEATHDLREKTIPELLKYFESDLDTPKQHAEAVRILVHCAVYSLFRVDQPFWYCRVLFQVLRKASSLRSFLVEEVLAPLIEVVEARFFRRVRSKMNKEECCMHFILLLTPIYFHADYMDVILGFLGMESFSAKYLKKMEDVIVRQTQLYFDLPFDDVFERGDAL